VPGYVTVNLGVSHDFDWAGGLTARLDVINAFDEVYEIRDGTGSAWARRNMAPGADSSSGSPRLCKKMVNAL